MFEIEADDPCLLLDAIALDDEDDIVSSPFEIVLVDVPAQSR